MAVGGPVVDAGGRWVRDGCRDVKEYFMKHLVLFILALGVVHPQVSGRELTVGGAVYRGNESDAALSDLWLTVLSKQPTLKVLDRAELRALLGEVSLNGVSADAARQSRLSGLLGIEYFAWVRMMDGQVVLEVVEAPTGRGLGIVAVPVGKAAGDDLFTGLAAQVVQVLNQPTPKSGEEAPAVAFAVPSPAGSNTTAAAVETFVVDVSAGLAGSGVTVLPRRFAAAAVQERWSQEKGLFRDVSGDRAFLGADYLISLSVETTNHMVLTLVETSTGRQVGRRSVALRDAATAEGVRDVTQWAAERLKPLMGLPVAMPAVASTNNVARKAPEILKHLYSGMVLHNQGRYLDALAMFQESDIRNAIEDETGAWIDSCYRLAGFPEVADDLPNARPILFVRKKGVSLDMQSAPGVALLGMTVHGALSRGLAERASMLLIDSLHKVSGSTVFTAEALAGLKEEYDLLLGLEHVKGTTWQVAPPMLMKEAVTAHLEPGVSGAQLRLCLIRNCRPSPIGGVVIPLGGDLPLARSRIEAGVRTLLSNSPAWTPPKPVVLEEEEQLAALLKRPFTTDRAQFVERPLLCLKALTRNPEGVQYGGQLGLNRWFLRVLPDRHPERPAIEYAFAIETIWRNRLKQSPPPDDRQELRAIYRKYADGYAGESVELDARYNLLLLDMAPTNFADTEAGLRDLLDRFSPLASTKPGLNPCLREATYLHNGLSFALNMPGAKHEKPGSLSMPTYKRPDGIVLTLPFWYIFEGKGAPILLERRTPQGMHADLSVFCFMKNRQPVPAQFYCDIIATNGPDSIIVSYVLFRYFHLIDRNSPAEKLAMLCPLYAESVCEVLSKAPAVRETEGFTKDFFVGHMGHISWWPKLEACDAARNKIQLAMTSAFPKENRVPRESFEDSWRKGPLKHHAWINACQRVTADSEIMNHYYPYLPRLHELFDDEVKTVAVCQLYGQFASSFFRAGRYDLAEPLLKQIVSWRDYRTNPPDPLVYVQSLYLLALLAHRNGDIPEALRLAKEVEIFMDKSPGHRYPLVLTYDFRADSWNGSGLYLRPLVTSLMAGLRQHPPASFKNPYR